MAEVVMRLVGLVVIVIVARLFSTEDFGRYSVALALFSMLTIPVESGMGGYLVREGTQHPERLGVVLGHAMVLAVLGVAGAGLLAGYLLGYDAETLTTTLLLTVGTARRFW